MTETLQDTPAEKVDERRTTEYVVLREVDSVEEFVDAVANTEEGEALVFAVVGSVDARDRTAAIKTFAIGDESVSEGSYVAVPSSSWKVHRVKTVVQLSLEES